MEERESKGFTVKAMAMPLIQLYIGMTTLVI